MNGLLNSLFGVQIVETTSLLELQQDRIKLNEATAGLRDAQAGKAEALREINQLAEELELQRNSIASLKDKVAELQIAASTVQFISDGVLVRDRLSRLGSLMRVKNPIGVDKVRLGAEADGGYVCLDDFAGTTSVVSVGIGGDVSWDLEMADRGFTVCQYDHTVDGPPIRHERFQFFQKKLAVVPGENTVSITDIAGREGCETPTIIAKIDIEGDEWDIFASTPVEFLARFSQLICEFHWCEKVFLDEFFETAVRALENLNEIFEPVHVHANNFSPLLASGNLLFPNVLELTFANKAKYSFEECCEVFPTRHDRPNNPKRPDYNLGQFLF